jgi:putative oxidoreductase
MSPDLAHILIAIGGVLMGSLYVLGGVEHFRSLPDLTGALAHRGTPFPRLVLLAGTVLQIAAGALLMLGVWRTWAAFALVAFTLAAGVLLLNFWDKQGEDRSGALGHWRSNIALIGGLLALAAAH